MDTEKPGPERMDQYLARCFPERSRREWKALLRDGRLRLGGRIARAADPAPQDGPDDTPFAIPRDGFRSMAAGSGLDGVAAVSAGLERPCLSAAETGPGRGGSPDRSAGPGLAPTLEFLDREGRWVHLVEESRDRESPGHESSGSASFGPVSSDRKNPFWERRLGLVRPDPAVWQGRVVFRDSSLLVLDKPTGMPSHPLVWDEAGSTLADVAVSLVPWLAGLDLLGSPVREAGLVNRLDNETSGLIVICPDPGARTPLCAQFRAGQAPEKRQPGQDCPGSLDVRGGLSPRKDPARKTYLALVCGEHVTDSTITFPVAHHRNDPRLMTAPGSPFWNHPARGQARQARSELTVLRRIDLGGGTSLGLVKIDISQGQHHQIRVHCAACGFPLAGDVLYGGINRVGIGRKILEFSHHFLHAWRLGFAHPTSGIPLSFEAPVPPDMAAILKNLGWTLEDAGR